MNNAETINNLRAVVMGLLEAYAPNAEQTARAHGERILHSSVFNARKVLRETIGAAEQATNDEQSAQADRESWQQLADLIDAALPDFRGLPAPTDHARLALQKIISDRAALLEALENTRRELAHWHAWRLQTSEGYRESEGAKECSNVLNGAANAASNAKDMRP